MAKREPIVTFLSKLFTGPPGVRFCGSSAYRKRDSKLANGNFSFKTATELSLCAACLKLGRYACSLCVTRRTHMFRKAPFRVTGCGFPSCAELRLLSYLWVKCCRWLQAAAQISFISSQVNPSTSS